MYIIETRNLEKSYNDYKKEVTVIKNLNLRVPKGKFVSIMGQSGCGKTTLLKLIGCLEIPTKGEIIINGVSLEKKSNEELSRLRRKEIGFVFQDYNLMDSLTIEENIMLPLILDKKYTKGFDKKLIPFYSHFNLEHLLKKYPFELSGGEQQRVAICRAITNNPRIILADEPTGNLDAKSSKVVIEYFKKININLKKTIIMVTHDPYIAHYSDYVCILKNGNIINIIKNTDEKNFLRELFRQIDNY